jgi:cytochrome c biogenesis protein CcmG, thiol:disulfide interchange protein DsbE
MNWRRAAVGGLVAVPVLALLGYGMTLDPRALPSTLPGKDAPAFALTAVWPGDDEATAPIARLEEHRGEVVVLNFWASWCLACRSEHDALTRVAARYEGQGVHFYGALFNDNARNADRYIRTMGGQSYPTLLDPGTRTAIDYGVSGVPETFFIDREGRVAYKHIGPVTERLLVEWIERLRAPAEAS